MTSKVLKPQLQVKKKFELCKKKKCKCDLQENTITNSFTYVSKPIQHFHFYGHFVFDKVVNLTTFLHVNPSGMPLVLTYQ